MHMAHTHTAEHTAHTNRMNVKSSMRKYTQKPEHTTKKKLFNDNNTMASEMKITSKPVPHMFVCAVRYIGFFLLQTIASCFLCFRNGNILNMPILFVALKSRRLPNVGMRDTKLRFAIGTAVEPYRVLRWLPWYQIREKVGKETTIYNFT